MHVKASGQRYYVDFHNCSLSWQSDDPSSSLQAVISDHLTSPLKKRVLLTPDKANPEANRADNKSLRGTDF
tara:strand:+ start:192 stop:404 length:213 start_codon:yes stop_codon:yes gene_type:complete